MRHVNKVHGYKQRKRGFASADGDGFSLQLWSETCGQNRVYKKQTDIFAEMLGKTQNNASFSNK